VIRKLRKGTRQTQVEKILYTAKAHTTGGRDGGASLTDTAGCRLRCRSLARRAMAPTRNNCSLQAGRLASYRRLSWSPAKEDSASGESGY